MPRKNYWWIAANLPFTTSDKSSEEAASILRYTNQNFYLQSQEEGRNSLELQNLFQALYSIIKVNGCDLAVTEVEEPNSLTVVLIGKKPPNKAIQAFRETFTTRGATLVEHLSPECLTEVVTERQKQESLGII